jgi:hypothetical protein
MGAADKKDKKKTDEGVGWAASVEAAQSGAQAADVPFLVYVCSAEVAKFAGDGKKAVGEFRKNAGGKAPPLTPFDNERVVAALKENGGLSHFAKVAFVQENAEVIKKLRVGGEPAVLLCAPTGEVFAGLAGPQVNQGNLQSLAGSVKEAYAAWKRAHPPKREKAELKVEQK